MKVQNMTLKNGNKVANQFVITDEKGNEFFQSYKSIIAKKEKGKVILDKKFWNYSKTTGRYRNEFLNETTKETQEKIKSGDYILANLN